MNRVVQAISFFIASISLTLYSQSSTLQHELNVIDQLKNDSLAITDLEKLANKTGLDIKSQLNINYRIINRSHSINRFGKAIELANKSVILAHDNSLDSLEAYFIKLLGISYYMMDRKKAAIPYFEKAIKIANKNNYWLLEASCYNNIGGCYADVQQYENAEKYLLKCLQIVNANGGENGSQALTTNRVLARVYDQWGKPGKAELLYLQLIEKSRETHDTNLLCDNLLFYSEMLANRGEFKQALEMSKQALDFKRTQGNENGLLSALTIHASNMAQAGNYKEAYEMVFESTYLMRKIFASDLQKEVSDAEVRYNTVQIQRDKDVAEVKAQKEKQIYLILGIAVLCIATIGIYIWNQGKNITQKNKLQQQRLENLIEGEEKERTRIARDLHDGIVQDLLVLKLKLISENKGQSNSVIDDIDRSINEVRGIAYQMMPVTLTQYGLAYALADLVKRTFEPASIQYDFDAIDSTHASGEFDPANRLPGKVEICLYRISQELIKNIVQHSKSSFASVLLLRNQHNVRLIIEDDGIGFNIHEIKKGIGINSITSRLMLVNGSIDFSLGDQGITTSISIPV